uniref:Endoglucanase n=1 Tax=Chenopodium quinoa TaxID=63459 RepID=A0A803N0Q4_CHEQI
MAARRGSYNILVHLFSLPLFVFCLCLGSLPVDGKQNYKDALAKSILFFEGQRSGRLPKDQRVTWRSHSGLLDGSLAGVNLKGGYYDAGDNVKFNLPMAFTTTMLSWGTLEFGGRMGPELNNARAAIRWATNYLYKCATATPGKLYVGVGDPNADHKCWERPEDMDTPRTVYSVSPSNPGSDVAGETAAALAAASIVLRITDRRYAAMLLMTAKKVMEFALKYRGAYSDSLGSAVCPFYCSYSGYKDELLWGAAWLYRATKQSYYSNMMNSLGANDATDIFSWDNKFAGARVLLSRNALIRKDKNFEPYKQAAEEFICRILPNSPSTSTQYTPVSKHTFTCGSIVVTSKTLRRLVKRQVDYILGDNPLKLSYMVGYGANYPKKIHHRASSLPSLKKQNQAIKCSDGFQPYYYSSNPNPNILIGAVVGGPSQNDAYSDDRTDFSHSEPATYINAAIVGTLASFVRS